MRLTKGQTKVILKAIKFRIKRITFDANLHDLLGADIPVALNCAKERRLLHESRAIIEAEMGIGDPLYIQFNERRNDYIVKRGRETFFDEDDVMYVFDTVDEAVKWCLENLDEYPLLPDQAETVKRAKKRKKKSGEDSNVVQLDLGI